MLGSLRQGIVIEDKTQLLLAGVVGVALGLSFAFISAIYVAITIATLFLVVLAIRSPKFAFVVILIIQSTVFSEPMFPRLKLGDIHIWNTDLILIGLFGLIFIRLLVDRGFRIFYSPVTIPLVLFLIWTLLTSLRGFYYLGNERGDMVIETRIVLYYTIVICLMYLIRSENNINFILRWFYILAVLTACALIIQYFLGAQVNFLSSGKIYIFSPGTGDPATTRVQGTVGEGLVTLGFILKTTTMFIDKFRFKKITDLVQWVILGAGLVTTFNRTHWIMVALVLFITAILVSGKERQRIILWGLVIIFVLTSIGTFVVLLQPHSQATMFINSGIARVATLAQQESYTDSQKSTLIWRGFEYTYGIPQIYNNPVMGIGMGAQYRPVLPEDHVGFYGWDYTHNSNLWIAMKTGLVGFFLYLWFSLAFVWHAIRKWHDVVDLPYRGFVLGAGLGILALLFGANLHPFGMTLAWVPVISIIIGLSEAIIHQCTVKR